MANTEGPRSKRALGIIDGHALGLQTQHLQQDIAFNKILDFCGRRGSLVTPPIYCIGEIPPSHLNPGNRRFINAIRRAGLEVITKPCKKFETYCKRCQSTLSCTNCGVAHIRAKADFDADIAFTIGRYAYQRLIDHLILFAADGDFVQGLSKLKLETGVSIEIVALHPKRSPRRCKTNASLVGIADKFTTLEVKCFA